MDACPHWVEHCAPRKQRELAKTRIEFLLKFYDRRNISHPISSEEFDSMLVKSVDMICASLRKKMFFYKKSQFERKMTGIMTFAHSLVSYSGN